MKHATLILFMSTLLLLSQPAFSGENCAQLGGACQNACRQSERPESGAFEDCGESQECCVVHDDSRDRIKCCIASFEAKHYGVLNCSLPQNNLCSRGSGSPVSCEDLTFCKEKK